MTHKALVTGGNRGIGKAIAAGLVREGLEVIIGARDLAAGQDAARDVGASAIQLDLTDPAACDRAIDGVTVLVNNAGVLWDDKLFDDMDHFEATMDTALHGPFALIRAALPAMEAAGYGRVVNVSSGWGSFAEGLGGGGAYGIGKAAMNALTVIANRDTPDFIKINSMCPGWVRTRMGGAGATRSPEEAADTAIWLATLPADGPSGGFFRDRKPLAW
ncbi:SDR family NAD(P)-dependent oxidoreductase [Cognatiyoonia sp. IB215446]|uniref:SDR family NAD(P)-dependent oxidoreductase n=1 Tax=Cognatiyoonia sp. IB215446 TaxID=3097355 RepID=UPI002A0B01C4|nr:SDR family NAD(P)-dependent oxidoreductase [Cognatiyoonia sp. IB215446]MDX8348352.1 SDR family NAD(P)-dependent oxidoreductase [Cognatiyoonia sp. IB215446]